MSTAGSGSSRLVGTPRSPCWWCCRRDSRAGILDAREHGSCLRRSTRTAGSLKAHEGLVEPRALKDGILRAAGVGVDVQQGREGKCVIRSVKQRAEVPSITVVPLIHTQLERRGWRGVVGQLPEEQGLPEWR